MNDNTQALYEPYKKLFKNINKDATIEDKFKAEYEICEKMYIDGFDIELIYYFLKERELHHNYIGELIVELFDNDYF